MKAIQIAIVVAAIALAGCASSPHDAKDYGAIAGGNSFEYYFPKAANSISFATSAEAYDFIRAAQIKLQRTAEKNYGKGLAAKLVGPPVVPRDEGEPITVAYFINTSGGPAVRSEDSDAKKTLAEVVKGATSVSSVFLVFDGDRAASIADFYLKSGYHYNNNSQYKEFRYNKETYEADYPVGWGVDKAFQYLDKNID